MLPHDISPRGQIIKDLINITFDLLLIIEIEMESI